MSDDFVYVGTPLEAVAVKPPPQQHAQGGARRRDADRQDGQGIDGHRRIDDSSLSNPSPASTSLPVAEQVALDAQGRRRFHGAFTGGFSAGYFNSVGSAEGWKPSSFVSSRRLGGGAGGEASTSAGAAAPPPRQQQQRTARDFMDDDELAEAEAREAAALRTARGYSRNAREEEAEGEEEEREAAAVGGSRGGNDAAALASLLLSSTAARRRRVADGVGARLLREMGWRRETFDDGDGDGGGDDGGGSAEGASSPVRRPLDLLSQGSRGARYEGRRSARSFCICFCRRRNRQRARCGGSRGLEQLPAERLFDGAARGRKMRRRTSRKGASALSLSLSLSLSFSPLFFPRHHLPRSRRTSLSIKCKNIK